MPIRKVKGGWKIDNVAGVSPTRAKAVKRLKAVKASQGYRKGGKVKRKKKR